MRRTRRRSAGSDELELDGYESGSSTEGIHESQGQTPPICHLSDAFDAPSGSDVDLLGYDNPLLGIHSHNVSAASSLDIHIDETEDFFNHTELVIKFNPEIKPEALKWFIEKVIQKKSHGGAELLLRREPYFGRKREGLVVHVTGTCWRQLETAELLELKKLDYSGETPVPREFKIREIQNFRRDKNMKNHEILTSAERQMVILHELKFFHSLPGEDKVPGYNDIKLVAGQSIFHLYVKKGLIKSYFALHYAQELHKLKNKWFFESFEDSPYEDIRSYFGDGACLYFNFIAYYSKWLLVPTGIGIFIIVLQFFLPPTWQATAVVAFCITNMVFLTIFLISWQRHQSTITYKWGTLKLNIWEEPRANYYGKLAVDPVTGRRQRRFPYWKTAVRTYFFSFSIVFSLCFMALWAMAIYIEIETQVKAAVKSRTGDAKLSYYRQLWNLCLVFIPATVYALTVVVANKCYRWLAKLLTEWENHRTEAQFQRHLILKMVVFEVTNNFCLFFYTAFILRDMAILKRRLLIFLIVVQSWSIIEQCIVPIILRKGLKKVLYLLDRHRNSIGSKVRTEKPYPGLEGTKIEMMNQDDPRVEMSKVEEHMYPYNHEADFDDYLNLFLQFGYVFLFSSVLPSAALIAFVCNIFFIWASLFKRREVYQRSIATRVSGIGAWQQAFELMAVIAVMTNCALIGLRLREHFSGWTDWEFTVMCFVVEHMIIGFQYFVQKVFPRIPYKVKVELAALEYHSKQAFKREQARSTRKKLTRVFQPVKRNPHQEIKSRYGSDESVRSLQVRYQAGQVSKTAIAGESQPIKKDKLLPASTNADGANMNQRKNSLRSTNSSQKKK